MSGSIHACTRRRFIRQATGLSLAVAGLTLLAGCRLHSPSSPAGKAGPDAERRPARVGVVHLGFEEESQAVVGLRTGLRELGYVEGRDIDLDIRAGPDAERRPARVGVVHLGHEEEAPVVAGLRTGLRELGYVEGRDIDLDIRTGRGRPELAREAVRELVRTHIDLLVSAGTVATQAAQELAGDRPIVFTQVGDPVGAGFVQSLARPGGTLTGFSTLLPATTGKRLELLRELVPEVGTVLIIFDPANPTSDAAAAEARRSAAQLRMRLLERHVKSPEEVAAALREVNRAMTDALLMVPDSLVANAGDQIIELSRRERVPVMFHEAQWVERGGLASYGPNFLELGRQAATYVDKILRGSSPAELAVQQPTGFDFVINLKAAQELGLMIPSSVLARATVVIP